MKPETKGAPAASLLAPLKKRAFRLYWIGESTSLLGDQFYFIALPWLVLQVTGEAFAVGSVLALAGLPRAVIMLFGGAFSDRYSPRSVLLAANLARMFLASGLSLLLFFKAPGMGVIYLTACLFGLADAFYYPAKNAILPQLADPAQLEAVNAITRGTMQLSFFIGPALAGIVIALFTESGGNRYTGLAVAFFIDTLTFLVSVLTLWQIRTGKTSAPLAGTGIVTSMREGFQAFWDDKTFRLLFIVTALINFLYFGPLFVGIPVMVDLRFSSGSAAYGFIFSALGAGALLGTLAGGIIPRPKPSRLGITLLLVTAVEGFGLIAFGLLDTLATAVIVALIMGAANGYTTVIYFSWLQRRTPDSIMGRIMGLQMFASVGLLPLASIIAGAVLEFSTLILFCGSGGLMLLLVILSASSPVVRTMGQSA